jgi:hypothetical protein
MLESEVHAEISKARGKSNAQVRRQALAIQYPYDSNGSLLPSPSGSIEVEL